MPWIEPLHSREEVNRAGRAFVDPQTRSSDREIARAVINNWRSCHGFPLNTVQVVLRSKVKQVSDEETALVAQRTKRLRSIAQKLDRFPKMDLARMHDIGGCRAVLNSIEEIQAVEASYSSSRSRSRNKVARADDYIFDKPKADGYRGIHVVINYQGAGEQAKYSGLRVEVQLRTKLMHAWATALETVDTFTKQALKSNVGDPRWLRFFALMGSEVAEREGTPLIPGTPADRRERREELRGLASALHVIERLGAYGMTIQVLEEEFGSRDDRHFLLDLNTVAETLSVRRFPNAAQAEEAYGALEGEAAGAGTRDIVLVAVTSMASLRRAYPNYFLDTSAFLDLVTEALSRD